MDHLIARLARARQIEAEYRSEVEELEAELAGTPAGRRLAEIKGKFLPTACADVGDAEEAVRTAALDLYESNGHHKQVHPAVTVKVFTHLEYDPEDAIRYAREHLPQALKLDRSAFEKAARVLEPKFVTVLEEPRATVARDLSAYVAQEPAAEAADVDELAVDASAVHQMAHA